MGNKKSSGLPRGIKDVTESVKDFHVFTDVPEGAFSYKGTGRDVVNFFNDNSNYQELIDNMTDKEIEAFKKWTIGHFMNGQQFLGFQNMSKDDQRYTRIYDRIIDKATIDQNIVVSRSAGFSLINDGKHNELSLSELKDKIGNNIELLGHQSTGAAKNWIKYC